MHEIFKKEHLIRITGTRGGMDKKDVGKRKERGVPRYVGKSFTLDIEWLFSFYAKIKSQSFIL